MSSENRRKLLKSIAAGGGAIVAGKSLPDKWTAPVVDTVLLPAHAQTSPAPPACLAVDDEFTIASEGTNYSQKVFLPQAFLLMIRVHGWWTRGSLN